MFNELQEWSKYHYTKNYNTQKNHRYKNDQKNEFTNHTIQSLASQYITCEYYESR